jgi:hypothetical protein
VPTNEVDSLVFKENTGILANWLHLSNPNKYKKFVQSPFGASKPTKDVKGPHWGLIDDLEGGECMRAALSIYFGVKFPSSFVEDQSSLQKGSTKVSFLQVIWTIIPNPY